MRPEPQSGKFFQMDFKGEIVERQCGRTIPRTYQTDRVLIRSAIVLDQVQNSPRGLVGLRDHRRTGLKHDLILGQFGHLLGHI